MPVPFHLAAIGGELEVPTLHGSAMLRIPAGTQSGALFRLRGKGVPDPHGDTGDQHVRVRVEVPRSLTSAQRKLMEQLATDLGTAPFEQAEKLRRAAKQFTERKEALEALQRKAGKR